MRPGTMQTMHVTRGFSLLRGMQGAEVLLHRRALTPPERFATLEVGRRVAFEPESSPKGPYTAQITVTPLKRPPVLLFDELAAAFDRHAASSIHDLTHLTRR